MEMCFKHHDEIVYDSRSCPLCKAMNKINKLQGQIDDLELQVRELEAQIEDLC